MYNRYVPQPDGSFRRNRISDPPSVSQQIVSVPAERPAPPVKQEHPRPRSASSLRHVPSRPKPPQEPINIGSFLRQLLPKGFDTEDLLIVLLLLLMSGDCREDQNTAILTLALYLFL